MDEKLLEKCYITKQNEKEQLFKKHKNLIGVGYGPKECQDDVTLDLSIRLYVPEKIRDEKKLPSPRFTEKLGEFPTDVIEVGSLNANPQDNKSSVANHLRPALGGTSVGLYIEGNETSGTLGMVVPGTGAYRGRYFILSNNHVLANLNKAKTGAPIVQPGSLDGGTEKRDQIGEFFKCVQLELGRAKLQLNDQPKNIVDAALAKVEFGNVSREIYWIGYPKGWRKKETVQKAFTTAKGRLKVQKVGRTTNYTVGEVRDLGFDGRVDYANGKFAYFEDQLLITSATKWHRFAEEGDSGAIVLDMENRIIGLLFGAGKTYSVANHIEDVWKELGAVGAAFDFFEPCV